MDTITSKHGLVPLNVVAHDDEVELSSLPLELQLELKKLKDEFTVGPMTLKKITKRFEQELQEGNMDPVSFFHPGVCADFGRTGQVRLEHCKVSLSSLSTLADG